MEVKKKLLDIVRDLCSLSTIGYLQKKEHNMFHLNANYSQNILRL